MIDFIGIGAQKSATTWMHRVLSDHPDVLTSDPKELNFFTANYDRGTLWYEAQFPDGAGVRGELSPTYFFSADAPRRARAYRPDLKLIVVLRDPVERAFSNHLHEIRKGHIAAGTSFEMAQAANPAYLEQSRYRANLLRWIEAFSAEQLLVILAEDIASAPEAQIDAVFRHIGVQPGKARSNLHERQHESVAFKHASIQGALRSVGDFARRRGLGGSVQKFKKLPVVDRVLAANRQDLRSLVAPMQPETRQMLVETFAEDVAFVAGLLERDSLPWPNFAPPTPLVGEDGAGGGTAAPVAHV
jgi:hypothetical protein